MDEVETICIKYCINYTYVLSIACVLYLQFNKWNTYYGIIVELYYISRNAFTSFIPSILLNYHTLQFSAPYIKIVVINICFYSIKIHLGFENRLNICVIAKNEIRVKHH